MATPRKFGAFAGVFTPSILTILGVIMFLRLPQIVGQAGLWWALGIVVAAHVISITTGLSVSSIATDKRVKAGGSYYIISRSLGLPIGGTLGLALFIGLSFSVSLYLTGFAESFLNALEIGLDPATGQADIDAVRLTGSIALVVVTLVTFISTSLAIKTQYFIMAAIVLALASVFIGNPDVPAATTLHLEPLAGGASAAVLFAIFFPAVTGFEAGVSLSGDLKDPRRDIPRGTLIAIAVGFAVYLGEVLFFAATIPADQLANNPRVLLDYAFSAPLVIAGIWGATLSSALGSILGAPRILQAVALDKIAPRLFARGSGPDAEPRNAILLAFVIAEGGILIGSLDAIAAVVTMFFMASYGVLNLSCAVESWASPDFRPDFRIPRLVSVVGAVTSFGLMIVLDPLAMIGALIVLGFVYIWLKRKELALEGGDTWNGIWASLVRKALDRLSRSALHHRNWRPNVLLFTGARTPHATRALAHNLVAHNGVMTEFTLAETREPPLAPAAPRPEGVFHRALAAPDPFETILGVARYHGIAGYEPNTVVVDWDLLAGDPARAAALLGQLEALGRHGVLSVHRAGPAAEHAGQVDVWWHGSGKNLALGLALVRFLSTAGEWVQATPRFLTTVADPGQKRTLERRLAAWLDEARVTAEVRVLDAPAALDSFEALVARVSAHAALVLVGLGEVADGAALAAVVRRLEPLHRPVLLLRAEPGFTNPFPHVHLDARAPVEPAHDPSAHRTRPATLELAGDPALSRHIISYHDALAQALDAWHSDGPVALLQPFAAAQAEIARLVERALAQCERAAATAQPQRRRRLLFRIERGLLRGIEHQLGVLAATFGDEQRDTLRAGLDVLADRLQAVEGGVSDVLLITTDKDGLARAASVVYDGRDDDGDAPRGRSRGYVRWPFRRFVAAQHAQDGRAAVELTLHHLREAREALAIDLDAFVIWALAEVATASDHLAAEVATPFVAPREALAARVGAWQGRIDATLDAQRREGAVYARDAAQRAVAALSTPSKTRRVRGGPSVGRSLDVDALVDALAGPLALQHHHIARAELDVRLRGLHRDLEAMVEHALADLSQRITRGTLAALDAFLAELEAVAAQVASEPGAAHALRARDDVPFDDQAVLQRMTDAIERDTEGLPEVVDTISEASFLALSEGRHADIEEVTIAVRRLVAFVLKTDLLGALRESLAALAAATIRAANAVRDVARLVSFAGNAEAGASGIERDELAEERLEIVVAGRDRVRAERAQVEAAWRATDKLLGELLAAAIERTRIAAIGHSAGKLDRFIRTHGRRGLGAWVGDLGRRVRDGARRAGVDLSYRWSRGVLLARRLKATPDEPASPVERIIALHRAATPSPAVWDALPIFYRQVFLGRAAADPAYWLEASGELAAAERAVDTHAAGRPGTLWVTGPQGAGVGAVLRRLTQGRFGPGKTFEVRPPEHGSIDPACFDDAVRAAVGRSGELDEVLGTLPEGSAVVVDELELWWERSPTGLAVASHLAGLSERHGDRVLFIIGVNVHVMRLLRQLGVMVDQVLATVHCQPLDALHLRDAVLRRHDATGLGLRLEGDSRERGPSEWKTARLFSGLFDQADGYIGAALHAWVSNIVEVNSEFIVVRRPRAVALDALDALDADWASLLLALVLHRRMDRARLVRVTGLAPERLDAALAGLARAGLVTAGRGDEAIAIDRFMQSHVERWLERREVL